MMNDDIKPIEPAMFRLMEAMMVEVVSKPPLRPDF
jgi:hypothetical protein